jgi:hypothetical protein
MTTTTTTIKSVAFPTLTHRTKGKSTTHATPHRQPSSALAVLTVRKR